MKLLRQSITHNTSAMDTISNIWLDYMYEIGETDTTEELLSALHARINLSNQSDNILFDIFYSHENIIGFSFYSIDGGIKNLIPPGYGYIMEFYILPDFRNQHIGSYFSHQICNILTNLGCPKIYLTAIEQSKLFWTKCNFVQSNLTDPDNGLHLCFH